MESSTTDLSKEILADIQAHVESWKAISDPSQISVTRMSGLSNACYRVRIEKEDLKTLDPNILLYRKFEN